MIESSCLESVEVRCNGVVFSTLPDFGEGGGPGVCEVLGLVSCFCCNGVALSTEEVLPLLVLSTEEILSNFWRGRRSQGL